MRGMLFRWSLSFACVIPTLLFTTLVVADDGTSVRIKLPGSEGQGLALMRGIDCYVVTAAHVLRRPVGIFVIGEQQHRSEADIYADYSGRDSDVAVLKVRSPAEVCAAGYYGIPPNIETLLQPRRAASLRLRGEAGDEIDIPVVVVSWDEKQVHFRAPAGTLYESASGSVLYIENQRVAMLVTIPTQQSGLARAIRFDWIGTLTKDYLRFDPPSDAAAMGSARIALEQLILRLNFLESDAFCESFYGAMRWAYVRKPTLRSRERRGNVAEPIYVVESLVIPGADSNITVSENDTSISTKVAELPSSEDPRSYRDRAKRAVERCIGAIFKGRVKNLNFRGGPLERDSWSTMWQVGYKDDKGWTKGTISIFLDRQFDVELNIFYSK